MTASARRWPLVIRLTAAFVVVALAAVAVMAVLALAGARNEVDSLLREVHLEDALAAATAAARAYEQAGGWDDAELTSAAALAARGQANLVVRDGEGAVIAAPSHDAAEMMAAMHGVAIVEVERGEPVVAPVVVGDRQVGTVELRFPTSHLPAPQREIRDALFRNVALGTALALGAAVAVAFGVARRVSRPIEALTSAAARIEAGDRQVRVDAGSAPGEIGELADAFDRMADAVEREDRLRKQLLADVAHEVRTPLAVLRGSIEALLEGVSEPDAATLGSLHEEVLRLASLVGDLETLAAADAARLELVARPVELDEVARRVVDLAEQAGELAGIEVVGHLEAVTTEGDEARIHQVLMTLVANALAYCGEGARVEVGTHQRDDVAVLTVADTGPGIDEADLPRIFDRFYRGRSTVGTSGSGIGLAVARELVDAHGGRITAENRAGGGAVFTVHLPVWSPR